MTDDALRALRLANSYLDDIAAAVEPVGELSNREAPGILADIARALAQIDKAEGLSPSPTFVRDTENGPQTLTSLDLRATALVFQGLTEAVGIGDLDAGVRTLERALSLRPDFAQGHFALAMIQEQRGRKQDARRAASRAAELAPDNVEYEKLMDRLSGGHAESVSTAVGVGQKQAKRKLAISYVVATVAFVGCAWIGVAQQGLRSGIGFALGGAYVCWTSYWAIPVVWRPFWRFFRTFPGLAHLGWLPMLFFFYVPVAAGYVYGFVGGGIYQFLKARHVAASRPTSQTGDVPATPRSLALLAVAAATAILVLVGASLGPTQPSRNRSNDAGLEVATTATVPVGADPASVDARTPNGAATSPGPTAVDARSQPNQSSRWKVATLPVARGLGDGIPRITTLTLLDELKRPQPYQVQYEPIGYLNYVADHLRARKPMSLSSGPEGFSGSESQVAVAAGATVRIVEAFTDIQTPVALEAESRFDMVLPFSVSETAPKGAPYSIPKGMRMVVVHDTSSECPVFYLSTSEFRSLCWPNEDLPVKRYARDGMAVEIGRRLPVRTAFLLELEDGRRAWTGYIDEEGPAEGWLAEDWITCQKVVTGRDTKMYCNE